MSILLCSECLNDHGLRLNAGMLGKEDDSPCQRCSCRNGRKLDKESLEDLVHRFFVHGTIQRPRFGGYPGPQFNTQRYPEDSVILPSWLAEDARLIAEVLKIGMFVYEPRWWMFG